MNPNMRMEQLSLAYIRAVAADAGYQVTRPELDTDSVDGILMTDSGRRARIEFQAKATARDVVRESHIHFPLSVKNYNDLRVETINPRILIVLIMPKETQEWINQTIDELCLRHCAYWMSLRGQPATLNTDNITIRLPLTNMLNCNQLAGMMKKTERREELC